MRKNVQSRIGAIGMSTLLAVLCLFANRPASAADTTDRQCRVVLRDAAFSSGGWAGFIVNVDVRKDLLKAYPGVKIQVRYQLTPGDNGWTDLEMSPTGTGSDVHSRFAVRIPNSGHPAMEFKVVAFAYYQGDRLFDHNFESGNLGNIVLNRSNNWRTTTQSCH